MLKYWQLVVGAYAGTYVAIGFAYPLWFGVTLPQALYERASRLRDP